MDCSPSASSVHGTLQAQMRYFYKDHVVCVCVKAHVLWYNTSWLHGHLKSTEPSGELVLLPANTFCCRDFLWPYSRQGGPFIQIRGQPFWVPGVKWVQPFFKSWGSWGELPDLAPAASHFKYQTVEDPASYWAGDRDPKMGRQLLQGPQLSQRWDQV